MFVKREEIMQATDIMNSGYRPVPGQATLNNYKVDFIDFEDSPDTALRVARECLERPSFITGLPDMPRLSAEPKRLFQAS